MDRIAVIGCGGSGKTTLANRLGRLLALPVIHIDSEYWRPDEGGAVVEPTAAEWKRRHAELIARPRWIIDGMKVGVLPARLAAADVVVFLDLPTHVCLGSVLLRWLRHRRAARRDDGANDRVTWDFLAWIAAFRRTQRPKVIALLGTCTGKVAVLRSRAAVERWVAELDHPEAALGALT